MGLGQHSEGDVPMLTTSSHVLIYGGQPPKFEELIPLRTESVYRLLI